MNLARCSRTILIAAAALGAAMSPAIAESSCKSSLFGFCTSRYTAAEKAKNDDKRRWAALLRDPARAAPELDRSLRQQVRYYNGTLVIEDQISHIITTFPATIAWSISCYDAWVQVTFGDASENGNGVSVELTPIGIGADAHACRAISGLLGVAVLRLTRGE